MDNIWLVGMTLGIQCRPTWSAFNQVIMEHSGSFDISGIMSIPFINLDPTNLTTIHSALQFALSESDLHGKSHCITTFDQPLFIKACDIVYACDSLKKKVFPRLGGFHFLMSFMGSIGNIMSGSGLEELWKSVYASETTPHMMSGHAYSRALRAHILTIEALTTLIMSFPEMLTSINMKRLESIYQELLDEKRTVTDALGDDTVLSLTCELEKVILATKQKGRTPTLWIQYYDSVKLILQYIRAERTGNWDLHVHCVKMMNKYLHAAGHLQMAKSGHLYLQVMEDMSNTIPKQDLKSFKDNGYFTIRRTHKLWSGVWTDMTIEQVLMRAMKTIGGLTRGRGMTNSTISEWIHCTQLCIPLCEALEEFTSKRIDFSEQHVDEVYKAHKGLHGAVPNRNAVDLDKFIGWFNAHSPFCESYNGKLLSIFSGTIADDTINCDQAVAIGSVSEEGMIGESFGELKLQRKDNVKSIASMNNTVKIHEQHVTVNPQQMLNRMLVIFESSRELGDFMKYELLPKPPSSTLCNLSPCLGKTSIPSNAFQTVDGGNLLHTVVWNLPCSYGTVYAQYVT